MFQEEEDDDEEEEEEDNQLIKCPMDEHEKKN